MFKGMGSFIDSEPNPDMREKKYAEFNTQMSALIKYYSRYDKLSELITYMKNEYDNWFTCILYEEVEPTNNFAEQALREFVVIRKIIGALRFKEKEPMIYKRLVRQSGSHKIFRNSEGKRVTVPYHSPVEEFKRLLMK